MIYTGRDKLIIECLLKAWDDGDHGLYGHLCYNDVFEFCDRLGIARPQNIIDFLKKYDKNFKEITHETS